MSYPESAERAMQDAVLADAAGDYKRWRRAMLRWLAFRWQWPTAPAFIEVSEVFYWRLVGVMQYEYEEDERLGDDLAAKIPEHPITFNRVPLVPVKDWLLPFAEEIAESHCCM